jgi:lysophospholipase L1-like esterase
MLTSPSRTDRNGALRSYVRFAALGDSATYGLGDPSGTSTTDASCRGWAALLVAAMGREHDVSFCNLAVPGARAADVLHGQLSAAIEHRPHLASLVVGINDTLRADWDPTTVHHDLLACADRLSAEGALLMTARFHDHTQVFRLPAFLARPMRARIDALNTTYDEIHQRFGGIMVDLTEHPGVYEREFWSADRLHPSELGHRALADEFSGHLCDHGLTFDAPGMTPDGPSATRADTVGLVLHDVLPWVGRRLKEFVPLGMQLLQDKVSTTLHPRPIAQPGT